MLQAPATLVVILQGLATGGDRKQAAPRNTSATRGTGPRLAEHHRAQADALEIEARAKRRLADEYDAAQERGEVDQEGRPKTVPQGNGFAPATVADLGLTRKQVHEARQVRDAEAADPGVVRRTLAIRRDQQQAAVGAVSAYASARNTIVGSSSPVPVRFIRLSDSHPLCCTAG